MHLVSLSVKMFSLLFPYYLQPFSNYKLKIIALPFNTVLGEIKIYDKKQAIFHFHITLLRKWWTVFPQFREKKETTFCAMMKNHQFSGKLSSHHSVHCLKKVITSDSLSIQTRHFEQFVWNLFLSYHGMKRDAYSCQRIVRKIFWLIYATHVMR